MTEVENQQLSEREPTLVVMESLGTKYKTVREGDATKKSLMTQQCLGRVQLGYVRGGQIMGIYCQYCKRAWFLCNQKKKRKDDQKILHEEESKESTMEEVNEREAEINGEQGSPPWQCQNFESFSYSKPSLSHCRRKKQKRRPENAA